MLWTPHMTILQKKNCGQFVPKGLFWTKIESFQSLEVKLWSLKRPTHIISTQHIQAHCFGSNHPGLGLSRRAKGALKGTKFLILAFQTPKMASVRVIIKTKKLLGILRLPLMIQLRSYVFLFGRHNICHLPCPRPPKCQLSGLLGQNMVPFLFLYN